MKLRLLSALAMVAVLFGMAVPSATFAQDAPANVRVIHASPDAPAVDIYVNGDAAFTNVPFFTVSDYTELPAGEYEIQITPTGESLDSAVLATTVSVNDGNTYTLAATGFLDDLQLTVFEDNLSPITDGNARVDVYHLVPDAPAVDIKLEDGTLLLENIPFRASTDTEVPAGSYDLIVTPAGEAEPVFLSLPDTQVDSGTVYHVFAINAAAAIAAELRSYPVGTAGGEEPAPEESPAPEEPAAPAPEEPAGNALVSVVHASPDAPAVDLYVDGAAVLTDVPFFTASGYLEVPAGDRRIQITPAGADPDAAVIDVTATLDADVAYTAAAVGALADIELVTLVDNLGSVSSGQARVGIYHFSPDAPAVDVKLADGTILASNVSFPNGAEVDVPAGTYDIIVTPAGETDPVVIDLAGTTLEAGNYYSVYATDFLASITPQLRVTALEQTGPAPQPTAAPEQPAPAPTAAPTPDVPVQLPETSTGNSGSTVAVGALTVLAVLLLGSGALVLARRRR